MTDDSEEDVSIPLSELRSEGETTDETESEEPESDSMPLSGLRDAIRERASESDTGPEDPFVEEQQEPVDTAGIWAGLLDGETAEGSFEPAESESGQVQVISKRICERCEYLAEPPELRCTHEGTAIRELVDVGHVRVVDCPMVDADGNTHQPE